MVHLAWMNIVQVKRGTRAEWHGRKKPCWNFERAPLVLTSTPLWWEACLPFCSASYSPSHSQVGNPFNDFFNFQFEISLNHPIILSNPLYHPTSGDDCLSGVGIRGPGVVESGTQVTNCKWQCEPDTFITYKTQKQGWKKAQNFKMIKGLGRAHLFPSSHKRGVQAAWY